MYYPKSEIESVSYTSGLDFEVKGTGKPYVGYYYVTNDGKYFSGKEYGSTTVELNKLFKKNIFNQTVEAYEFHYAKPSDADYQKGFFTRFVLKRVNSGFDTILEISESEYQRVSKNPLYLSNSFSWKLTGPLYTTSDGIPGIVNTNQKTLDNLEKSVPEVKKYFTNLAQYAK